jgi:hypothetical protein
MTWRSAAVAAAIAAIPATATLAQGAPTRPAAQGQDVILRVGDHMQVEGQPIGCQVVRKDGQVVVDCRRAGTLAGTYGTFLGRRKAMVARFRSDDVAKVVFTARHRRGAHACTDRGSRR